MNDRQIEDLMRRARPVQSPSSGFHQARQELLEEIMSSQTEETLETGSDVTPLRIRPVKRTAWLAGVAAAAALVLPLVFFPNNDETVSPAADLPQQELKSDGNPYLFVENDDWKLTELYQGAAQDGSETFTRGRESMTISWLPMRIWDRTLERLGPDIDERGTIDVFGQEATILGLDLHYELLIPVGEVFVTVRIDGIREREAFLSAVSGLRVLQPQEWEAALGEGFVRPETSVAVAEEMLSDVPVPAGLEAADLRAEYSQDRYYFGIDVLRTVSCAWLEEYAQARAADDDKGMAAVDDALSGHREWAVLQEMNRTGDWGSQVPIFAAKVAIRADVSPYQEALSCDR
ncbi:hypothetical protein [Kineosporia babensis]|uniref:Uncharacterized protein n=1 Tax=Kineosporia babensis TaxID=499548 RepID=A0A9X1SWZ1_9ACTN|nr:hypothetical protein [Kineosporia babensis]MCD5315234.1 hypothetical protein [Kineosporia babensis]